MAASFSANDMQVNFESVLAMEHNGMVQMFKSLEETGLKDFFEVSISVFEGTLIEFFANSKVIAGTIVSFVANRKLVVIKDVFAEAFGLPTEGMVGVLDLPAQKVVESLLVPIPEIPDETVDIPTIVAPEDNMETTLEMEGHADNASTVADQEEHVECTEKMEIEAVDKVQSIVIRCNSDHPAQQPITSAGKWIFALVDIREIKWAMHFLPKIDPAAKGKEILESFARPNPVEEHCLLVLNSAWEDVSSKILAKIEDQFMFWAETEWVSKVFERRMLVLYKLYEMEVKKIVDDHRANFNPAEPSVNYDYMCIRFIDRELKEIFKQYRAQRTLAGLPFLVPETSVTGDAANADLPQIT
ncbi:U-box domain-containing protein 43-like [Dorcoceras hygrometricum]|uniref:U-box domain-containing protein 43-like n=1 Tax=Dorcoceras hygrometricum TaxID=472368 RepID=A0A2Z7A751_9LAMI|nr:U-box domain-containing protein 43-like [Dorcoceras hygrometricum]